MLLSLGGHLLLHINFVYLSKYKQQNTVVKKMN